MNVWGRFSYNAQELAVNFISWISMEALDCSYATSTIIFPLTSNLYFNSEHKLKWTCE